MKSPWKFLLQLTSQRRPSDEPQRLIGLDGDEKPVEREAPPTPDLGAALDAKRGGGSEGSLATDLTTSTAAPGMDVETSAPEPLPVDVERVPLALPDDAGSSYTANPSLSDQRTPILTSPKAQRNKPARGLQAVPAGTVDTKTDQPSPSGNPVVDEATRLDEDIRQLRRQLTEKLQAQNDQLREMLRRFDRS